MFMYCNFCIYCLKCLFWGNVLSDLSLLENSIPRNCRAKEYYDFLPISYFSPLLYSDMFDFFYNTPFSSSVVLYYCVSFIGLHTGNLSSCFLYVFKVNKSCSHTDTSQQWSFLASCLTCSNVHCQEMLLYAYFSFYCYIFTVYGIGFYVEMFN